MRKGRELLAGAVLVFGVLATAAQPALADGKPGGYVDEGGSPTATVEEVSSGASSGGGRGGGGGGGRSDCWWEAFITNDHDQAVYEVDGSRLYSATGRWLKKLCGRGELVDQQPEGGLVDVDALARRAAESVPIGAPQLRTSPDAGGLLYVQLPTWFWIAESWWRDYTAEASTGRVKAIATARPVSVTWSTGDGATVDCDGPGRAWVRGVDDEASDCRHTYRRATGRGRTLTLSATVKFDLTWSSNIGRGGTLESITRTATVAVRVGEIQALETE